MTTNVIYLVQRLSWRVGEGSGEEVEADDPRLDVREDPNAPGHFQIVVYHRQPNEGGLPVRAFRNYLSAERFRRECEHQQRRRTNPFRYGDRMEQWSSLDEGRFRDWLLDLGLTPPDHEGEENPQVVTRAWNNWWLKHRAKLTYDMQLKFASALNTGLAGLGYGQRAEGGPIDLPWLDAAYTNMGKLTAHQRQCVRTALYTCGIWDPPQNAGERDFHRVIEKWRDWWDEVVADLSPSQFEGVWNALDKIRFYELIELSELD